VKDIFPKASVTNKKHNDYPIQVTISVVENGKSKQLWKGSQRDLFRKYRWKAEKPIKDALKKYKVKLEAAVEEEAKKDEEPAPKKKDQEPAPAAAPAKKEEEEADKGEKGGEEDEAEPAKNEEGEAEADKAE